MQRSNVIPVVLASVAVLLLAGPGEAMAEHQSAPASASPRASRDAAPAAAGRATVKVMNTRYGRILTDGNGRALYLFTRDERGPSRCYGDCAREWPPLYTTSAPRADGAARGGLLDTVTRRNGRKQVTYRGQPLYYYVGDSRPGEVLCQNVFEFGGLWLVLRANGRAVR